METSQLFANEFIILPKLNLNRMDYYYKQTKLDNFLTSFPWIFFQRSHFTKPGRQYSTTYASVYSWPWPLPNRPCVRIAVNTCICSKSICRYSLRPRETICFGHQAPPLLSIFNLKREWRNNKLHSISRHKRSNKNAHNYKFEIVMPFAINSKLIFYASITSKCVLLKLVL